MKPHNVDIPRLEVKDAETRVRTVVSPGSPTDGGGDGRVHRTQAGTGVLGPFRI